VKITVFGAGAWGTALAAHMAQVHDVLLWGRNGDLVDAINVLHQNPQYLAGIDLPAHLRAERDFHRAAQHALMAPADQRLWVLGGPMGALRLVLQDLVRMYPITQWPQLVWLCKGFEEKTALMPHQVVESVLGQTMGGALTGPSFAAEVAKGLPCALTAASADASTREIMVQAAHHGAMRVYELDDLIGAEVGGALKNIMALASGLCDGLHLGLNARAALITRGLAEMKRLAHALGARAETLNGLSGIGDLLLTCTGDLSRNRRVGLMLAQGMRLPQILQELGQVAEGVKCSAIVAPLALKLGIDMPIVAAVNAVLFEDLAPRDGVMRLLSREAKVELGDGPVSG
jgi:glycerol-3-phosphate dehydrogenase (NAD(P)+)